MSAEILPQGQPQVGTTDLLAAFGLGPRACEDCGQIFTVPPYMDCAKWKFCTPCSNKRFNEWAKTPDAKKAIEMLESGIGSANDKDHAPDGAREDNQPKKSK